MQEPIRLAVTVEVYQPQTGGNLRLSETVALKNEISLGQAAELMARISEVLKASLVNIRIAKVSANSLVKPV